MPTVRLCVLCALTGCGLFDNGPTLEGAPMAQMEAGPRPSEQLAGRQGQALPALDRPEDVPAFVTFASASLPSEREAIREVLADAGQHDDIVQALVDECERAVQEDFSRAVVALGMLGEMRSSLASTFLLDLLHQPLPQGDEVDDGGDLEQIAFAQLQAKAAQGLVYLQNANLDPELLRLAGKAEHVTVRAEIVRAWLYNHPGDEDMLLQYVRLEEQPYVFRPQRLAQMPAAEFDQQLAAYLAQFPDRVAPPPERTTASDEQDEPDAFDQTPPPF